MSRSKMMIKMKLPVLALLVVLFGCSSPLMEIIKEEVDIVTTPPAIVTLYPESGAEAVAIDIENIVITFSKSISSASVNSSSITVTDEDGNAVTGTYSVSAETVSFNPSNNLAYNTLYTVNIGQAILDTDGNNIDAEFSWSFSTASPSASIKPIITYLKINDDLNSTNSTSVNLDISATDYNGDVAGLQVRYKLESQTEWSSWTALDNGLLTVNNFELGSPSDGDSVVVQAEVKDGSNIVSNISSASIIYDVSSPNPEDAVVDWSDPEFDLTSGMIQIIFEETIDWTTVSASNFYIELEATPGALQGVIDLKEFEGVDNRVIFMQGISLNPYTDYKVTLGSDVADIAGNETGVTKVWYFRTGQANDVSGPEGPVVLIDRGVGAVETVLPSGILATSDYRIRLDLSAITDDYHDVGGMKIWGDNEPTPIMDPPSSWSPFPATEYIDWDVSNTPGIKSVLYQFVDSTYLPSNVSDEAMIEIYLDNTQPTDPVLTINEGQYTNNDQRIVSLSIDSSDIHTGLKEMNIFDSSSNSGWIEWSDSLEEWQLPNTDGQYTITVNVRDYVHNTPSAMGTDTIILDRAAPSITIVTDHILTGTAVTITTPTHYTASEPGAAAVESGIASYHWEQQSGIGTISFSDPDISNPQVSANAEDSYYLRLTVTDNAGNSGDADILFTWDATPPGNISSIDVTQSNPGYYTTDQPTWSWTAADEANYYLVSFDNFSTSINIGNELSYTPEPGDLGEGLATLYVRAYDFAGNYSSTISQAVTIDSIAPTIQVTNGDFISNIASPTPIIDYSDLANDGLISGADTILWEQTGGPSGGVVTFGTPSASSTTVSADLDGYYDLMITASDNAGNETTIDLILLNDLNKPNSPDITGPPQTPNRTPTWYWGGNGGGIGTFRYSLYNDDDGIWEVPQWTVTENTSYKPPSNLTDVRNYILYVQEVDEAGNWSDSAEFTTEVNTALTTPAQITIGDGEPVLRTINSIQWDVLSGAPGTATAYRYRLDSGTWIYEGSTPDYGSDPLDGSVPVQISYSGLSEGNHTLTVVEYFNSAWQDAKTATHTITVDTIAPNTPNLSGEGLSIPGEPTRTATNDNYPTWSWSTGGGGNGKFMFSTNGGSTWTTTTGTSYTPYKTEGTYELRVKEIDDAGNESAVAVHSITVDTTPPILTSVTLSDPSPYNGSTTHTNSTTVEVRIIGNITGETGNVKLRYLDYNPVTAYEDYGSPFETDGDMTITTVLPSTNGTRAVYAQLVDEAGNGSAYRNDSIILDTVAPSGSYNANGNQSYTPSLYYKMNFNVTDNLTSVANLKVSERDRYNNLGNGTGYYGPERAYSAVMSSNYYFSKTAGTKFTYARVYDEAGNYLSVSDSIYLQVPVPTYAFKGYYTTGYSNIYYNPVTEDPGSYLTRYYAYSTTDPNADPNNGDPVTSEGSTTSTSYKQAYIPKGQVLYFFVRAYNADTGGWGPYSATNVMGFSSNVTVVYDKSDSTDAAKAQYIKELLEDTYFSGSILDESNIDGSMPTYTVTLLDEDLINNSSYSTQNTIYGDPIIVTPGTAFSRLDTTYDIRARHIANGGRGLIGMGYYGTGILDRIEDNWSSWGLSGTAPTQIGSGESAGNGSYLNSKSRGASISESIWHSPLKNVYFTSNFLESNITLNIFQYNVYRYGVYLPTPSVSDGYIYAAEPSNSNYYPVVRQGRFLQYGYTDIPGRGYTGSMTYQYGQVFFINLIARMDNF